MNPHSPSFPMEMETKDKLRAFSREQDKHRTQILNETFNTPTLEGKRGIPIIKRSLNPHNYRLYFVFNRKTLTPTEEGFDLKNHDSEYHTKELINGCHIVLSKETATVINKNHIGNFWKLYGRNSKDIDVRIGELRDLFDFECIEALRELIRRYGGYSDYEILKRNQPDIKIRDDSYLDSIPKHLIIDDYPYFKKYYKKQGDVEFYGFETTRNYLISRTIDNVAPEIAEEMALMRKNSNLLLWLKDRVKTIGDLSEHERDVMKLSEEEKQDFSNYLFTLEND